MNKYLVEFLGTLIVSFVIFSTGNYLAIGATFAIIIFLGGPISGGMYNPAISIAMSIAGKLSTNDLIPYIISQIGGALGGYELFQMSMNRVL